MIFRCDYLFFLLCFNSFVFHSAVVGKAEKEIPPQAEPGLVTGNKLEMIFLYASYFTGFTGLLSLCSAQGKILHTFPAFLGRYLVGKEYFAKNTSPLLSRGSKVGGMIWVAPEKGSGLPFWREEHWHMDKRRLLRALSSVLFFLLSQPFRTLCP